MFINVFMRYFYLLILPLFLQGDLALAQITYTKLHDFSPVVGDLDGDGPLTELVNVSGVLYGTTTAGGVSGFGTIYKINTDGTGYAKVLDFDGVGGTNKGRYSSGSLLYSGGVLYGTTFYGGTNDIGCVFKINPDGTGFSRIHDFGHAGVDHYQDGSTPILSGGVFYGNTPYALYKMNADGTSYSIMHTFGAGCTDTYYSEGNLLISGSTLYGSAYASCDDWSGCGSIYKINTDGTGYAHFLDFAGAANGCNPDVCSLILSGSVMYGLTSGGGTSGKGVIYKINTDGTGYTKLHDFSGADGDYPMGPLTISGNLLYGTTEFGGTGNKGTVFRIKTDGTGFTKIYEFSGADGNDVWYGGKLTIIGTDIYGVTRKGGTSGKGVIYKLHDVTLPIELISFDAKYDKGKVISSWVTATETNNDYFTLERSQDGANFKTAAIVKGAGNSSMRLSYSSIDTVPFSDISYYRLKQTDFDGKYSYSQIVGVNSAGNIFAEISVYPNPFNTNGSDNLSLKILGLQNDTPVLVVLCDVYGKEYYSKMIVSDGEGNVSFALESSMPLAKGVYIIKASGNNKLLSKKIVVE